MAVLDSIPPGISLCGRAFGAAGIGNCMMPAVEIVEVGPRDGLQNEAKIVPAAQKVELIRRLIAAVDPAGVEAQVSGGIVWGLQAALWGEVLFADGAPQASNFSDYRMPTLADMPPIEVALLAGSEWPGSVGESSVPPLAPALANAIADAGGPRIRRLPIARTLEV